MATIRDIVAPDGVFIDGDWVESKDQDPDGEVRLVQLADVGDGIYRDKSARFLTTEKAHELSCTFLCQGDVLIARMPEPLGRACIFPGDAKPSVTVVDVCIVRTGTSGADHRWLMNAINAPAFRSAIAGLQSGTTRQRISRSNLSTIEFPLPPLAEQRRIVAAIEQQFTRLDAALAALRRAQTALKRYRASVLKSAVAGHLTASWRAAHPEVEPATALLARILTERRARWAADLRAKGKDSAKARYDEPKAPDATVLPELPDSWCWATVDQVGWVTKLAGFEFTKYFQYQDSGPVRVIRGLNVGYGEFRAGNFKYIDCSTSDALPRSQLHGGELLIAYVGSLGTAAVLPEDGYRYHLGPNVGKVVVNSSVANARFLVIYLSSPDGQRIIDDTSKAVAQPSLSMHQIRNFNLPLPSLAEQQQIVAEVERRLSVVAEVEAEIAANLTRAGRLRQSILRQAFAGRLAPQNPTDEPASALLERIRRERRERMPTSTLPKQTHLTLWQRVDEA